MELLIYSDGIINQMAIWLWQIHKKATKTVKKRSAFYFAIFTFVQIQIQ